MSAKTLVTLDETEYWERPVTIETEPDLEPVTEPLPATRHRAHRPVWWGITRTRRGWHQLLLFTFTGTFTVTIEVLVIVHHVL